MERVTWIHFETFFFDEIKCLGKFVISSMVKQDDILELQTLVLRKLNIIKTFLMKKLK